MNQGPKPTPIERTAAGASDAAAGGLEPVYGGLARIAVACCQASFASIVLTDCGQIWCTANAVVRPADSPSDDPYFEFTAQSTGLFEVADVRLDERFHSMPAVDKFQVRSYAGCALRTASGDVLGALAVYHTSPRRLSRLQRTSLKLLAQQVAEQAALRAEVAKLQLFCGPPRMPSLLSTMLYGETFDQAPVGIAFTDSRGQFLRCNPSFCALLGFEAQELTGRSVSELTYDDDAAATSGGLQRLWSGAIKVMDIEKRYIRKSGEAQWVRVTTALVREGNSTPKCAVEFLRDITDRKRTEEALRLVSERFALAADAAGIGVWEWNMPSNTLRWDDQMYRLYGLEHGERADPYEMFIAAVHVEDRERAEMELKSPATDHSTFETEYRVVIPTGGIRHLRSSGQIQRDSAGMALRIVGITFDITKRKTAEQALIDSEFKFRSLFELSPVGIALNDLRTGQFLDLNEALAAPTGFTRDELLGMTYWDITPACYKDQEDAQIRSLEQMERYGPYEKEYMRKDGSTYAVLLAGIRAKDSSGRAMIWSIVQDISLRKAMESQLTYAARRDKLTGLANRAVFMERLQDAIVRVQSGQQPLYGVLFLDFDRFKLINDTLGHDAGDELLRQIAQRLRRELRASDTAAMDDKGNVVSRFGGDEFLILINDLRSPTDATSIAERLIDALAPAYDLHGSEVHSSASIGIITSDQCKSNAEEVVRNADVAMYEAKRAGRACSVVFNEAMQTRLSRHVTIENNLRRALGTSELYLVYQPIVDLSTGKMVSVEALLRWNHPTLGQITPTEFIPIAEESGLIVALGQWVQNEACRAMAAWREHDPLRAQRTISVNISRAELAMGPQLLEQVRTTLERVGLPARCLQLEVTEREVMHQPEEALALLLELQTLGVQLAMDDFGTGTSSLGCLRNYPFNTVKIDRSFVQDLTSSPDVLAVIHATIHLVENLGMASLAEGVEESAQVAVLLSLGCRYAQGYFFSSPVAADLLLDAVGSIK
jgi:diguanylate cyclase (GGDEF)-like protein/PAS domain S-box-containing protein